MMHYVNGVRDQRHPESKGYKQETRIKGRSSMNIMVDYNGQSTEVNASEELAQLLADIGDAGRGHFAFIRGHVSGSEGTKCETPEISDRCFMQRPHYGRYKARMAIAIESNSVFSAIRAMSTEQFDKVAADCDAKGIEMSELYETCKETVLTRLDGDDPTTAGQRAGQAANHASFAGWQVHLKSAKTGGADSPVRPVHDADNGLMTVDSVMLPFFQIRKSHDRDGLQKGKWRPVNSRVKTIMQEAIKRATGIPTFKKFSLSKRNFESIHMSGMEIAGFVSDAAMAEIDLEMGALLRDIGALPDSPSATLKRDVVESELYHDSEVAAAVNA